MTAFALLFVSLLLSIYSVTTGTCSRSFRWSQVLEDFDKTFNLPQEDQVIPKEIALHLIFTPPSSQQQKADADFILRQYFKQQGTPIFHNKPLLSEMGKQHQEMVGWDQETVLRNIPMLENSRLDLFAPAPADQTQDLVTDVIRELTRFFHSTSSR